jgi:hypothetical protein
MAEMELHSCARTSDAALFMHQQGAQSGRVLRLVAPLQQLALHGPDLGLQLPLLLLLLQPPRSIVRVAGGPVAISLLMPALQMTIHMTN